MDALSILVGGMLGVLAGWAFSSATSKNREANELRSKASKAKEKEYRLKDEAKNNQSRSLADMLQGFLLYALGISVVFVMGVILIGSVG